VAAAHCVTPDTRHPRVKQCAQCHDTTALAVHLARVLCCPKLSTPSNPPCAALPLTLSAAAQVCYEYKDDGETVAHALERHPDLRPLRDIIIANGGIHMDLPARAADMARYVRHVSGHRRRLPIALYRETSPQHFEGTPGGLYIKVRAPRTG
jgi:hypothetical protein